MAPLVRGEDRKEPPGGHGNEAGIVGFARRRLAREGSRRGLPLAALRDRLEDACSRSGTGATAASPGCQHGQLSFEGAEAEDLLIALDLEGVAVSTGAACAAGGVEPSHVLRAMGLPPERASPRGACPRRGTTPADVDHAADVIAAVVARMRK